MATRPTRSWGSSGDSNLWHNFDHRLEVKRVWSSPIKLRSLLFMTAIHRPSRRWMNRRKIRFSAVCMCQNASDWVLVGRLLTCFIKDGTKPYRPYDIRNEKICRVYVWTYCDVEPTKLQCRLTPSKTTHWGQLILNCKTRLRMGDFDICTVRHAVVSTTTLLHKLPHFRRSSHHIWHCTNIFAHVHNAY